MPMPLPLKPSSSSPRRQEVGRRDFLFGGTAFALGSGSLLREGLLDGLGGATPEQALHFFDTLALMRGNDDGSARPGWIRKWTGSVAVCPAPGTGAAHLGAVQAVLAELCAWTGLRFALADEPIPGLGALTIRIMAHDEVHERYGDSGAVCMTSTYGNGGRLHTGHVEVSERYADCLRHELMHALGFDNHWQDADSGTALRSVLAPRHAATRASGFSRWDALAVRALYHPALEPGMPRDVALPIAREIVGRLLVA